MPQHTQSWHDRNVCRWRGQCSAQVTDTDIICAAASIQSHSPLFLPSFSPLSVIYSFLKLFLAVAVKRFLGLSLFLSPFSSLCRWFTASPSSMLAVKGLLLSPWSFLVLPYQLYIPFCLFNPFSDNILFLSLPFTHVSYLGGYKLHLQVSQPWLQRKTWLNIKVLIFKKKKKKKKRKSTASFFILPVAHSLGFAFNNSIGVHVKTQDHTSELLPGYNTFVNKTDFVNVPEFWKRYTNAFHSGFHSLQVSTLAHFAILLSFSSS